jgi:hypothetical protein
MNKKTILSIVGVIIGCNLLIASSFTAIFVSINPSAADYAFGNNSGAANIWNTNPLSVWSNPAKLGYHKNFSFGYSHDPWFDKVFDDMYHISSYMSYGFSGIGVLFPVYSARNRFGTVMSYGERAYTDEEGNIIGTYETYDAVSTFALGVNTVEFLSNIYGGDLFNKILPYGELSFGASYDYIDTFMGSEDVASTSIDPIPETDTGHRLNYGLIGRVSPINTKLKGVDFINLDLVLSYHFINPAKSTIKYRLDSEEGEDELPWGRTDAFSVKLAITSDILKDIVEDDLFYKISKNLFSVYYSEDKSAYGDKEDVLGEGVELTFLDIFSIRRGEYEDHQGEIVGETRGYGFRFHYDDIVEFQYNRSSFPGGGLQTRQSKWDIGFNADLIALYNLVR